MACPSAGERGLAAGRIDARCGLHLALGLGFGQPCPKRWSYPVQNKSPNGNTELQLREFNLDWSFSGLPQLSY